jgi:hypothetical protein
MKTHIQQANKTMDNSFKTETLHKTRETQQRIFCWPLGTQTCYEYSAGMGCRKLTQRVSIQNLRIRVINLGSIMGYGGQPA